MKIGAGGFSEAELLLHAAWMPALARRLVDGEDEAEDAAQEALVAALERPPRHGLRLRAWFSEVLRNTVRRRARAQGRRVRREAGAARPAAVAATAELAAEAELQREVVAALLALAEPYRSTLVLRFYRDLEPAEIARLEGVPAGTVRSRLSRGLELLRARLDARCGGREAWSATLAPLASWTTAGRSGLAATAGIAGGIAMGIKAVLAAAVAAAVVGAAFFGLRGAPDEEQGDLLAAHAPQRAEIEAQAAREHGNATQEVALAPQGEAGERSVLASTPARATHTLRILARLPDDEPVAGAALELSAFGKDGEPLGSALTDAEGRAQFAVPLDLERVRLVWSAAGFSGGNGDFDARQSEIEVPLGWLATLTGVVRDAETGEPLTGAEVFDGPRVAVTGADGRYRLDGMAVGQRMQVGVRKAGYAEGESSFLMRTPGEAELDLRLERGFPLVLRVYDRESELPLVGASIARSGREPPLASTDASGVATLRVALGGELSVHVSAPGYCPLWWVRQLDEPPAPAGVRFPLVREAWVEGRVADEEGRPVAGAWLYALCDSCGSRPRPFTEEEQRALGLLDYVRCELASELVSDAEGRFRLPVVPCGHPLSVSAGHSGSNFAACTLPLDALPIPGAGVHLDVRLRRGGTIRGRALENGERWDDVQVVWKDATGDWRGFADTDTEGRYELANLEPGLGSVMLYDRWRRNVLGEARVEVKAGEVVEQDFGRTVALAEIRGRVTVAGKPLSGIRVEADDRSADGLPERSYDAETDAEGNYRLRVPEHGVFHVGVFREPTHRARDGVPAGMEGVDFDFPALGRLKLRVVEAGTKKPVEIEQTRSNALFWRLRDGTRFAEEVFDPDVGGRQDLIVESGLVDVLVHLPEDGYAPRLVEGIRVPAGGASEIATVELARGLAARLRFTGEGVAPADLRGHLLFLVEEAELGRIEGPFPEQGGRSNHRINGICMRLESPTLLSQLFEVGLDGAALVPGLGPGRYHLRVYPEEFVFEPASFDLPAPGAEPLAVRWRRR